MKRFVILSCFLRGLSSTRFSPLGNHAAAFGLNKLLGNGGYHYLFGCKGKDFVWNEQGLLVEYGKLIRCDEDLGRSTVAHFARKVSYNAGAATDDCASQCKSPLRGRYR